MGGACSTSDHAQYQLHALCLAVPDAKIEFMSHYPTEMAQDPLLSHAMHTTALI